MTGMSPPSPPAASYSASLAASIRAAHQWWADAGVEIPVDDALVPWILEEEQAEDGTAIPVFFTETAAENADDAAPAIGGDEEAWPQDLEAFQTWWMTDPTLECGGLRPRIPPRGHEKPALMVIVPMPEAEDEDTLLSGPHGQLVRGICTALNLGTEDVYLASALSRHMQLPDWDALDAAGLGKVLQHHIRLVQPERVLAFGNGILPLLSHASPKDAPQTLEMRLVGTSAPEILLRTPRLRAALWRQLLDWTEA